MRNTTLYPMSEHGMQRRIRLWLWLTIAIASIGATATGAPDPIPWKRHTIDASSRGADGARAADVNNDGLPDLVTGWEEGGIVRAYLNPGPSRAKAPWPAVTVGQVASPEDAVFVDVNRDGAWDVVSACEGKTRTLFIHWAPKASQRYLDPTAWRTEAIRGSENRGSWMFTLPLVHKRPPGVALIVGSKGPSASASLLSPIRSRRPAKITGWAFHRLYNASWIMSIIPTDVESDGDLDIIISDRKPPTSKVFWLENANQRNVAHASNWTLHEIGWQGREIMFVDTGDLDGNERADIAAAIKPNELHVSYDIGAPHTLPKRRQDWHWTLPETSGTAKAVKIGDLDLDGRPDLAYTCEHAIDGKIGVGWITLPPAAAPNGIIHHDISGPEGVKFDRIELLDLDRDGDLDLVTCEENHNLGVIWYENPVR